MPLRQTQILERAERLASALAGGATRVERNVLLAVVGDFMADRRADPERLRRTLRLLRTGSGGHLKRGGSYARQIEAVTAELERVLATETIEPIDLKSLFGWTARLLLVRGVAVATPEEAVGGPGMRPPAGPRGGGPVGRAGAAAAPGSATKPAARPAAFGGLNPKGLSALEKLRQQLAERDKDKQS